MAGKAAARLRDVGDSGLAVSSITAGEFVLLHRKNRLAPAAPTSFQRGRVGLGQEPQDFVKELHAVLFQHDRVGAFPSSTMRL